MVTTTMGKKKLADEEIACCYGAAGVDDQGRATELRLLALSSPHTQAFHLAWLSLFACFFAAFAAPPILPALRPALVLAPADAPAAAVGSLSATLHWMSGIFAPSAVGLANAVAAGWANVGSAAAQLVMPLAYELVLCLGVPVTVAWRVTYLLVPCALLITTRLAVLAFPYDLPRGAGVGGGAKTGKSFWEVVRGGVAHYRAWVLALTYGYCYGVELIMENVAADFFRKRFHLPMEAAGAAAACFGAINAVARPAGGVASNAVARLFGMRGRLWVLWAVQTAGAALCVLVGRMGAVERRRCPPPWR
ncbi:putative high-affinity nitrate transporter 2.4 [Panicum miliaceum]|uniref:High-affinity nitrate transporter 2.4 n=1 Tax=Panicum miliaceum TaxID=4540 RepID=A0A3L6SI42_PANMI|nr:putative high-affinity nitrate transporter 2.4 [Panicum miliaceum]